MQSVQQPAQKFDRISLLRQLELARARHRDLLEELVRTDLRLEQIRVPHLSRQFREPLNELCRLGLWLERRVVWCEEKVPERGHVQQRVDDHILVVVRFDVVQTDVAWEVRFGREVVRGGGQVG